MKKLKINFPLYITKRIGISKRDTWFVRIAGILIAFLLAGILCSLIKPGTFGEFFAALFRGSFSNTNRLLKLLCAVSIYLLLSVAVTPAFKMKFWNIGAEGQAMAGCIVTAVVLYFCPASMADPLVIVISLFGAIAAGMLFALIPTFFKVKFNTNETLFTLLMNYVATPLALFTCAIVDKSGHNTFPQIDTLFPGRVLYEIGGVRYLPIILCAVIVTVLMYFYLKKTKQGFELSVLGDSANTARYVGIKRKKVSYRTMAISGAIAGLVGFLLVCCQNGTLTSSLVAGRGFTAVLIAWLGYFNPGEIAIYSFLVGFLDYGTNYVAGQPSFNLDPAYFSGLIIGLFILTVVIAEFFTRYKVNKRVPNEVSIAKSKILNIPESKIDSTILFKEFASIDSYSLQITLSKAKRALKKAKIDANKKIKIIKKQLLFGFKLEEEKKNQLRHDYQSLKANYQNMKNQYFGDKKLLRIKRQAEKALVRANTTRLESAINNKIATTILVFKSGSIVYSSKEEVKNFFNNMHYTSWKFSENISLKNILKAHRVMVKEKRVFDKKCRDNGAVLSSEILKNKKCAFDYALLGSDMFAYRYLQRRKLYFKFMVKMLNSRNLRLEKKKGKQAV